MKRTKKKKRNSAILSDNMCLSNSTFHCGTWRMLICSAQRHLPPSLGDCALQLGPLGNSCG